MSCVTRILVLRGTTAQRLAFTPLSGELVWDTDLLEMFVGDGTTLGGIPLSNLTTEQIQDIIGALIGDSSTIDVTYNDAGDVLTMDVITSALDHNDLQNSGTNTHAQIDAHIADTTNPHTVTITQAINADGGTDITVAELETLTDGSEASGLHNHDSRYYTESEINLQQLAQDNALTAHTGNTNNPHSTTFSQVVAADAGTDITPAEAETLTDTSDAGALHNHDAQYKKSYWQGAHTTALTNILAAGKVFTMTESKNSDSGIFTLASNELEINKAADFKFDINITLDTETGARETGKVKLQRDSGGGFIDIPASEGQSSAFTYNRNIASGEDTASIGVILTAAVGDKFRVLIECPTQTSGATSITTVVAGCGFIVEEK